MARDCKRNENRVLVDKSDYFASITSLNGAINGSPGPYNLDIDSETLKVHDCGPPSKQTWASNLFNKLVKYSIIMQNLLSPPYLTM